MQHLLVKRLLSLGLLTCLAAGGAHATGTLRVDIQPNNTAGARVLITHPTRGVKTVTGDQSLNLLPGRYSVVVIGLRRPLPIVDSVFGVANKPFVTVINNRTVTVAANYAQLQPGTGRLWIPVRLAGQVQGLVRAQLGAGTDGPGLAITGAGDEPINVVFDGRGAMWVASFADNTLLKYGAAKLRAPGGSRVPDLTIRSDGNGSLNGPLGLAFFKGNLWVGNFGPSQGSGGAGDDTLVRFTPQQLTKSGQPTPGVVLTGFDNPYGHVFDAQGNLWVGNNRAGNVVRIPPAQQASSRAVGPANVVITETLNSPLRGPRGVTFDRRGRLWLASAGNQRVAGYTIAGATATPFATITLQDEQGAPVPSPDGLAFDNGNALWVTATDGNLYRYAAADLPGTGNRRASLTISGFGPPQAIRGVLPAFNPRPRPLPASP